MFLFERMFGIACYFLALLFVFFAIYYNKVKLKNALIFYVIVLVIMAYFYEPPETADLYRIERIVEALSRYNLKSFSKLFLVNNTYPIAYYLYWIIGKIGNINLLPALVSLVTYSITFYIIYKSSELYGLAPQGTALLLLFVMSTGNYMMVISNIRTMLAISLLCLCFFRESVQKKFGLWHLLLYATAALIHNLAIVLLVIRCLIHITSSAAKIKWKILAVIAFAVISLYAFLNYQWLIDAVLEKAIHYLTGDYYSYVWEYVIAFLALLIETFALLMYMKNGDNVLKESWTYLFICIIIALAVVTEFSIFHRLITYIAPILAIPVLAVGLAKTPAKYVAGNSILMLSLLMLVIACFRGSLSSLKFFVI